MCRPLLISDSEEEEEEEDDTTTTVDLGIIFLTFITFFVKGLSLKISKTASCALLYDYKWAK